jgi:hypothetical protein
MANGPRWILAVEIVHDRDVAMLQGRQQELNHPGEKALGVDQPLTTKGATTRSHRSRNEGQCFSTAVRYFGEQPLANGVTAEQPYHVRGPGPIDKDVPPRINLAPETRP